DHGRRRVGLLPQSTNQQSTNRRSLAWLTGVRRMRPWPTCSARSPPCGPCRSWRSGWVPQPVLWRDGATTLFPPPIPGKEIAPAVINERGQLAASSYTPESPGVKRALAWNAETGAPVLEAAVGIGPAGADQMP